MTGADPQDLSLGSYCHTKGLDSFFKKLLVKILYNTWKIFCIWFLGPFWICVGLSLHEFIHALGFDHEQNRPDRDEHVQVHWQRIRDDKKWNFQAGFLNIFWVENDIF